MNIKHSSSCSIHEISLLLRFQRYTICYIFASTIIWQDSENAQFFRGKIQIHSKINLCLIYVVIVLVLYICYNYFIVVPTGLWCLDEYIVFGLVLLLYAKGPLFYDVIVVRWLDG